MDGHLYRVQSPEAPTSLLASQEKGKRQERKGEEKRYGEGAHGYTKYVP